jgi:hypothetical protein
MKKRILTLAALGALALVGCGTSSSGTPDASIQPNGTVPVNFSVDDTANKVYASGDLQWKGAMKFDPTTRMITKDSSWGGPFAVLYDDGPWTTGGHEPIGATAGDKIWGITIFVTPPATGTDSYAYGLNDANACSSDPSVAGCNGWSWLGDNGTFAVAAGATAPVNATGRTFAKFGTVDLQLKATKSQLISLCQLSSPATCSADADCNDLQNKFCNQSVTPKKCALKQTTTCTNPGSACTGTPDATTCTPPDTSKVTVKGSAQGWSEVKLVDDGAGNFIFTQSAFAGAGKPLPHAGLANSADKPEFIFVFNGSEYLDRSATGGPCAKQGITASTKASGASTFTAQTITTPVKNCTFTVP